MTTAIIELDHLQKTCGKFAALKDGSFTLAPGQVLGFLGPNGAGKSTTIRVILGLLKKSGGPGTVFGKEAWRGDAAIHPPNAYGPGEGYLLPKLSGGENIVLFFHLNWRQDNKKND